MEIEIIVALLIAFLVFVLILAFAFFGGDPSVAEIVARKSIEREKIELTAKAIEEGVDPEELKRLIKVIDDSYL